MAHDLVPRVVGDALRDAGPAGRNAGRQGRVARGGPAADVHRGHRDGAARGPGLDASPPFAVRRPRCRRSRLIRRCGGCAERRRGSSRSRTAAPNGRHRRDAPTRRVPLPALEGAAQPRERRRRQPKPPGARAPEEAAEIGAPANPPGFDEGLLGVTPGTRRPSRSSSRLTTARDGWPGASGVRHRRHRPPPRLPALDDEFAKDLGNSGPWPICGGASARIWSRMQNGSGAHDAAAAARAAGARMTGEVPEGMVAREVDRRVEEFARRLMEQGMDPRQAAINWEEFRTQQQEPAVATVKSVLVLDAIARAGAAEVSEEELDADLGYAARGRSPANGAGAAGATGPSAEHPRGCCGRRHGFAHGACYVLERDAVTRPTSTPSTGRTTRCRPCGQPCLRLTGRRPEAEFTHD